MNAPIKWSFDADYLQACSCDYGCPCEFSAPPTKGFCEGMGAWKIEKGRFGNVPLDGLALGFAARWPKAIHEGNGTLCVFIDEKASPEQRDALLKIASGQMGGLPFEILATTITNLLEPRYVPFRFRLDGKENRVDVGDAVEIETESIRNPVTKEPEDVRVDHGTGFIFKQADALSSKTARVEVEGLKYSWPDKAAFVAKIHYEN